MKPDDRLASVFRFATELVAWVATPWALWRFSPVLAVLSVVILIGIPTIFGTPGDKKFPQRVGVPGFVTAGIVLMQMIAAVWSSWVAWWPAAAIVATLLAGISLVTEQPRWRWLAKLDAQGKLRR